MTARRPWSAFLGAFWPFVLGCVLIAGGLAAIVIGWLGVSGTVYVGLQIPYLVSGAALGLALVIVGTGLLLVQVMTRQTRLMRRLLAETERPASGRPVALAPMANGHAPTATGEPGPAASSGGDTVPDARSTASSVLVVRGGRWFHRTGCMLVEGRRTTTLDPHQAQEQGLSPCRLCDPVVRAGR
jgi:hypothetical protein